MIITFCGHKSVSNADEVWEWLDNVLDQFIHEDELIFYLGGYGSFDLLAASVVRQKKRLNPQIQAVLVIPYLNRESGEDGYDYTVYPPLESVPPRYAISKRNEWMVMQADVVVAYVTYGWGGAAKALEYAQRKKKRILLYPDKGLEC